MIGGRFGISSPQVVIAAGLALSQRDEELTLAHEQVDKSPIFPVTSYGMEVNAIIFDALNSFVR